METESELISQAESVVRLTQSQGHDLVVIGAAALAAHHDVRRTNDLDPAGNLSLDDFYKLGKALENHGCTVNLREPDADDPLGGVLDITGHFGQIQIISFPDRFPAVIRDALQDATLRLSRDSPLRIIPLPHLVVLKLYAGGLKSMSDIVEVLLLNKALTSKAAGMPLGVGDRAEGDPAP